MKTILLLICLLLVIGCASKQPKQDPAVAVVNTQAAIEKSQRASGSAIEQLNKSLDAAEKSLDEAERDRK